MICNRIVMIEINSLLKEVLKVAKYQSYYNHHVSIYSGCDYFAVKQVMLINVINKSRTF